MEELTPHEVIRKTTGIGGEKPCPPEPCSPDNDNDILSLGNLENVLSGIDSNLASVVLELSEVLETLAPLGFDYDSLKKYREAVFSGNKECLTLTRLLNTASMLRRSTDVLDHFVRVLRKRVVAPPYQPDDHEPWEKS
ncbi:MAG TPA: hypothetical protein PK916_08980 [Bacteroidota bacterium]|nr:hypothetical protein [Bacteroidota bacterium]